MTDFDVIVKGGRPAPIVPHRIPWMGSGVALARDPDAFVEHCVERYGSAFTVLLPGGPRTFLTDPFDFPRFFQNEDLVFRDLADALAGRVFGFDARLLTPERVGPLVDAVHRLLKGDALAPLTERMSRLVLQQLQALAGDDWVRGGLYHLCQTRVFAAGVETFFGDGFYTPELFRSYALLDKHFALLAAGVPAALIPGASAAQEHLGEAVRIPRANRSAVIAERAAQVERAGIAPREGGKIDAGLVWASQANTVATVFWTALHVLCDPRARAEIAAEIRDACGDAGLDGAALGRMPKLDSATTEAMRLTSMPLAVRVAARDLELALDSGALLQVRAGDQLCLYPRRTHVDPEIYADPHVFQFDRFLSEGGPKRFHKQGRRVPLHLLPFGGGQSMCPGRSFARNEVKIVVATLLSCFDVELCSAEVPGPVLSRVGLGVPPPVKDVPLRIRRRARR